MRTQGVSKYNRISARKARPVADMLRGKNAVEAFSVLKFTPKKSARLIEKTLKSAVANAENNFKVDKKNLIISEIMIDEGPTLKRYRPRSRGMASPIMKRTSHITVIVEDFKKEMPKRKNPAKAQKKSDESVKKAKAKKEKKNGS